eukprot:7200-Heterococcus_DN1.PRE.1
MGASGTGGQALATAVLPIGVLPVNDAPTVALSAEQLTVAEDTLLSLSGLSVADVDAHEGSGLVELRIAVHSGVLLLRSDNRAGLRVLVEQPLQLYFQGTVAAVNAAFAGLSYRSAADWSGLDTLTITVSDLGNSGAGGAQSAELSAPITVTAVNDAPSVALPATALTVSEDGQLSLSELSVSDVDLGSNRCTISLAVEHGLLRVEASTAAAAVAAVVYAKGGGASATAQLLFSAALTHLNAVLSQVVYTPDADCCALPCRSTVVELLCTQHGIDTLVVEVNDGGASGAGGPKTSRSVLPITVQPVNDAPQVTAAATRVTAKQGITTVLPAVAVADADGPRVMLTVTVSAASGSVSLLTGTDLGGLQFPDQPGGEPPVLLAVGSSSRGAVQQQQLMLRGTQAVLTSALSRLAYTSAAAHSGDDAVTVQVQDDNTSKSSSGSSADALESSTVILITVQPERAPPLSI